MGNISRKVVGFHSGSTEPINKDEIWFDPTDSIDYVSLPESIIFELKDLIVAQRKEIDYLKVKVAELNSKVENLSDLIGGGGGVIETIKDAFLLEDGTPLLLEDGTYLKLEGVAQVESITNAFLLESKEPLLLENGNYLKLEA